MPAAATRNRRRNRSLRHRGGFAAARAGAKSSAVVSIVSGTVIERRPFRSSVSRAPTTLCPITWLVPGRIAQDVSLGRLLTLPRLGIAQVEVEHVVLGVVVGPIERQAPDRDVHALHVLGSFRLANTEIIRAGTCS